MFKPGDIVECIDDYLRPDLYLLKGQYYTVTEYIRDSHKIKLKGMNPYSLFRCSRFKLIEKRPETFGYKKGLQHT